MPSPTDTTSHSHQTQSSGRTRFGIGAGLMITVAMLSGLAPFSIDLYLPAFPAMTTDLATTPTGVQFSLTAFLLGAGAGQLVFGPWSDKAGRVLPLLVGASLFVVASWTAVFAGSVEVLVGARLLQGLGGAAGMVIGRAIIVDRLEGTAAARALNIMMLIGGVAPIVAPVLGGILADTMGWRGLLGIVGFLGVAALVLILTFVRESLPESARRQAAGAAPNRAWRGLATRGYLGNLVGFAFSSAIMMAYISASPFVYQEMIGLSATGFGIAFAVNSVGMLVATSLAARLVGRFTLHTLIFFGLTVSGSAVITILAMAVFNAPPNWLMVPLFLAIAPLGLVFGNTTALAMAAVPPTATGAGSALLGTSQFALAGVVTGLVGIGGEHTALPLALIMFVSVLIAVTGLLVARTPKIIQKYQETT